MNANKGNAPQSPTGLIPETKDVRSGTGEPGGGKGRLDITGVVPEDVHVDPNITQGHPGYQESGGSEITPPTEQKSRS